MGFFVKLALGGLNWLKIAFAAIKRFFAALNVQGWVGLIASVILAFGWLHSAGDARHWKKQSDRYERLYNGELEREKVVAKQALALKAKIDAATASMSAKIKEWNDEKNRLIAADADALRLHGPGKAACPGSPRNPATAGQPQPANRAGDAAVDPLPDGTGNDIIALPFDDTIAFGEDHDAARAENIAWRRWYSELIAIWPKEPAK